MKISIVYTILSIVFLAGCGKEVKEVKGLNGQPIEKYEVSESSDGSIFKDGYYKSWYMNGQIHIDCQYKENKKDGNYIRYYKNGTIEQEGEYKDDLRDGKWIYNHSNGQVDQVLVFDNGKIEGKVEAFYDNGTKRLEGVYEKDKQQGLFTYWNSDGEIVQKKLYKDGVDITIVGKWLLDDQEKITYKLDGTCVVETSTGLINQTYSVKDDKLKIGNTLFTIKTLTDSNYTLIKSSYFGQQVFNARRIGTE
jgi:antitoxin component YwqK of YwqJK toxin-antitoxin module